MHVPARGVHSAKWEAPELQDKGRRLEAAKRHAQQTQQEGGVRVEMQPLASAD